MSASWPTSVVTTSVLYVAVNELQNNLSGAINNSVTTLGLNSTTGFPTVGLVLIDNEIIKYTGVSGNNLTGCTRAFDGTTAASHSSAAIVSFAFCAAHYNNAANEVIAVESYLDTVLGKSTTVTATEFGYLSGVTSAIQTQLTAKAPAASPTFTGTITTPLTASRVVTSNGSSQLAVSTCTTTEIDFVHGVTSAIQTQLDGKASTSGVLLTTTDQSASGVKTFSGQLIGKGTATNDSAAAGYIGEYVVSAGATPAIPATGNYGDCTSISLTAGDWELTGFIQYDRSGGGTWTGVYCGISTTTGNSSTGLTPGDTAANFNWAGGGSAMSTTYNDLAVIVPAVRMLLSGTTTVYLKMRVDYTAGTPTVSGSRLSARRKR